MKRLIHFLLVSGIVMLLQGCNSLAYTNSKLEYTPAQTAPKASFELTKDLGHWKDKPGEKTLFVLALSGGGSRAAYWSASAMLRLQTIFEDQGLDLLSEVDAISSISGGSIAAAYYAISADSKMDAQFNTPYGSRPVWQAESVKKTLSKKFVLRWFGNWFWPHNILRYWLTAYDRTDIMAETLADNLYDTTRGHDFTLGEINPDRPNLILNSTIGSGADFAKGFSFTDQEFRQKLCSDINDYDLSRAVMGSASFPAAFNSMTLKNYAFAERGTASCIESNTAKKEAYLHVIDGGSHDNLGLRSAIRFLRRNHDDYTRVVVLLIDAYTPSDGVSSQHHNPRTLADYIIDSNFIDSVNSLMDRNRSDVLNEMSRYVTELRSKLAPEDQKQVEFYHATFESIGDTVPRVREAEGFLLESVNSIATSLMINRSDRSAIDEAVDHLLNKDNVCLQKIAALVSGLPKIDSAADNDDPICTWSPKKDKLTE